MSHSSRGRVYNNITLVTDSEGKTVTAVRTSDGFFNVTMLTHASDLRPTWRNFMMTHKAHLLTLVPEGVDVDGDRVLGYCGGTWVHPIEAAVFAHYCGMDVPALKDHMPEDTGIAQRRVNINASLTLERTVVCWSATSRRSPTTSPSHPPTLSVSRRRTAIDVT